MPNTMGWIVAGLAFVVALQYLILGAWIVPRLSRLADNTTPETARKVLTARAGASAFLIGCGFTHLGFVIHTFTGDISGYGLSLHSFVAHVLPHIAQIGGGVTFGAIAYRHLDVQIHDRRYRTLEAEKEALLQRLQELATRDSLTGLLNRRAFDDQLEAHQRFIARYGPSGAVLYLDIDGFKECNDRLGHKAGDQLLVAAARVLLDSVRSTDLVGRLGGDEFAVLLREAGPAEAAGSAERIVREIAQIRDPIRITASVGVASFPPPEGERCVDIADGAMYRAKRAGGNRYVVA